MIHTPHDPDRLLTVSIMITGLKNLDHARPPQKQGLSHSDHISPIAKLIEITRRFSVEASVILK